MGAPTIHPAMPMLRQAERTLASAIAGGLDQFAGGSEEISGLILQLSEAGLSNVAAALQRSMAAEDRGQRAGNLLRAYAALGIVRSRLADGVQADLTDAPLLSESSRLHIPPVPAEKNPTTLDGALALLKSQDALHRLYAAEHIPQWGEAAIPGLLALALPPKQDPAIKRIAARCISQIDAPASLDALVKLTGVLDAWREVNDGLMQRGNAVVEPLQKALSVASADGSWLMAKVLWRLGAKDALKQAYIAASAPKIITSVSAEDAADKKGKKAKKDSKPKGPEINKAFQAYHVALTEAKQKLEDMKTNKKWYMTSTERAIYLIVGLEMGLIDEDTFTADLDSQQRNELRTSLRHVYGSPAQAPMLDYYRRMQRSATKYADIDRARIGVQVLGEAGLDVVAEPEEEDEE
jgi:hypothetical protein